MLTEERVNPRVVSVLKQLSEEIPGFLYSAVVDMEMASPVAELRTKEVDCLDATKAASLYTDMVKAHLVTVAQLGGEDKVGHTSDMFIATDKFYIVLRPMPEIMCYQSLLITRDDNLGQARFILQKYSETLEEAIRG